MRRSEGISGPVWEGVLEVDLRVILGQSEGHLGTSLGPYLGNLINNLNISLIWP